MSSSQLQFPLSLELSHRESVTDSQLLGFGPEAVFVPDHGRSRDWREWCSEVEKAEVRRECRHAPHLIAQADVELGIAERKSEIRTALVVRGDLEPSLGDGLHWLSRVRRQLPQAQLFVAAYPETHPRARSKSDDLEILREKLAAGADAAITQFCFTREAWCSFAEDLARLRIPLKRIHPGFRLLPANESVSYGVEVPAACRGRPLLEREAQLKELIEEVSQIWGKDFQPHFFIMQDAPSWIRVFRAMSTSSANS